MEKALLSGGFGAIKWHIRNRELNREIGASRRNWEGCIFVTNKTILYAQIPRSYPARQTFCLQKTHPAAT